MENTDKILKEVLKKLCCTFGVGYSLIGIIYIVFTYCQVLLNKKNREGNF